VLTTEEEKISLLREFGIDEVVVLGNTKDVINQSALSFFEKIICRKLNTKYLVAGGDFAFGRDREGNIQWLKKRGMDRNIYIDVQKPLKYKDKVISSTYIRKLIEKRKISEANRLLGREYSFEGIPKKGRGLGRKLGFPTVNLETNQDKLLATGVYAAWIQTKCSIWPGIVNVGRRPTFFNKGSLFPEIHLINFKGKWPALKTLVHLVSFIRDEKRFSSVKKLKRQIKDDVRKGKKYFNLV
jgi:riboflavin kinase/FMN adenylyltransferase